MGTENTMNALNIYVEPGDILINRNNHRQIWHVVSNTGKLRFVPIDNPMNGATTYYIGPGDWIHYDGTPELHWMTSPMQALGTRLVIIPAECVLDHIKEEQGICKMKDQMKQEIEETKPNWTTDEKVKYAETANALGETAERYFTRLGRANEVVRRIGDLLDQAYLLWQNAPAEINELIELEASCDLTDQAMSKAVTYWNNGGHTFKLKMKNIFDADPDSMRDIQLMLDLKRGTSISTQGRCEQA